MNEYTDETIKRAIGQYEQDIMTLNCCIQGLKMELLKRELKAQETKK